MASPATTTVIVLEAEDGSTHDASGIVPLCGALQALLESCSNNGKRPSTAGGDDDFVVISAEEEDVQQRRAVVDVAPGVSAVVELRDGSLRRTLISNVPSDVVAAFVHLAAGHEGRGKEERIISKVRAELSIFFLSKACPQPFRPRR